MKEFTCIMCPRGCRLTADSDLYELTVSGNACERGREYAESEYSNPVRTVTFNVGVSGGERRVVSARTARPVPLSAGGAARPPHDGFRARERRRRAVSFVARRKNHSDLVGRKGRMT